jgi:hypothetical protein
MAQRVEHCLPRTRPWVQIQILLKKKKKNFSRRKEKGRPV